SRGARPRLGGAQAGGGGGVRLPRLPLASVVPGALPAGAQSDRRHRRAQAPHHDGGSQGRDQVMTMRVALVRRARAALMLPLVLLHIAVIFYATRRGMTASDILSRTHGSIMWASYYGLFVAAASIHASIGVRNVLTEWSPLNDRRAGVFAIVFGVLLAALGARAVFAMVMS